MTAVTLIYINADDFMFEPLMVVFGVDLVLTNSNS